MSSIFKKNKESNKMIKRLEELSNENKELKRLYKNQIDKVVRRLEELKQDKVYVLEVEKNADEIKEQLEDLKQLIPWTLPPIIVIQGGDLREKERGEER